MIKVFGNRDGVIKAISVIIIVAVLILSFDVFTQNKDGRKQIVDQDGGIESELCIILSDIEGVGNVDVMLQYDKDDKITGAIVTADGAGNPVVKNNLINAVMAVFNISSASVEVFEKKSVEEQEGTFNEK
jgi:stage III sporulation protein AG